MSRGIAIARSAAAPMAIATRVGQRGPERVAQGRDAQRGRAVAEQERDDGVARREDQQVASGRRPCATVGAGWTRPPGTIAATPVNPRNATSRIVTRTRRPVVGVEARPGAAGCRASSASAARDEEPGRRAGAGTSHSPNGTSRMAPRQATAATDGRMSDSIGTPAGAASARRSSASTWSVPNEHRAEQEDRDEPDAPAARSAATARRSSTAARARSRRAQPVVHRRDGTRDVHRGRLVTRGPACRRPRRAGRRADRVLSTLRRLDPGPPRLADAPAEVVELARSGGRPSRSTAGSPTATARRARSTDRSSRCGEPFISSTVPVRAASA